MSPQPENYGKQWTRDELILAFELYCRIPFQQTKASNPEVQALAKVLKRSPGSIARKLGNFGAFDPELARHNISGLGHGSKLDHQIWEEFHRDWNGLVATASKLRNLFGQHAADEESYYQSPSGPSERVVTAKQRIHQTFFRQAVLSSYESTCCVTGVSIKECLVASHIIPWSRNEQLRADPTNGLCMTATFDRLFDVGLMTITPDFTIDFSHRILHCKEEPVQEVIAIHHGKSMFRPRRFLPSQRYLIWHQKNIFCG